MEGACVLTGLRFIVVLAWILALLPTGQAALAQAAPGAEPQPALSPDDEAQRLSDQAVAAYEKGDYPTAERLFKQAHALRADPTLLYNLAKIYEKLNDPGQAVEYYRRYLVADSIDPKLQARAEARVKALSQGSEPKPGEGGKKGPAVKPAPRPGGALLWSGVAIAAVGVAGLAVGIGLDAASASSYTTFMNTTDEFAKRAAKNQAQSLSSGALAGYVVGAVLLAGGGTLFGLGLKKRRGAEAPQAVLYPVPGGGAALLGWRF
jgi:tetratricopeptide (TPR) repeat protein